MTNIISVSRPEEQAFQTRVDRFFHHLKLSNFLQKCNFYNEAGVSSTTVFKELFSLVFHGQNLYRSLNSQNENLPFRKSTDYRFLNSHRFKWERLLKLCTTKLIQEVDPLTADDRQSVMVIDDSPLSRNRSKKVELLAKVFDHTSHKFFKGFRMLTLGWSDGNTFMPLGFTLLSGSKDANVLTEAKR